MGCAGCLTRDSVRVPNTNTRTQSAENCTRGVLFPILHTLLTIDNNCVPPSRHPKLDSMPQKFTFTGSEKVLWNLWTEGRRGGLNQSAE